MKVLVRVVGIEENNGIEKAAESWWWNGKRRGEEGGGEGEK